MEGVLFSQRRLLRFANVLLRLQLTITRIIELGGAQILGEEICELVANTCSVIYSERHLIGVSLNRSDRRCRRLPVR
jgi:uncharacterized membrane protein YadS